MDRPANDNIIGTYCANDDWPDYMAEEIDSDAIGDCYLFLDAFVEYSKSGDVVLHWQTIHCKSTQGQYY